MSVVLPIERVLRGGEVPIREGLFLFNALLAADTRVVLTTEATHAAASHWLMQHGIKGHAAILDSTFDLGDGQPLWQRQIQAARAAGRVDMVVANRVEIMAWCLEAGVTCVLFAAPKSAAPEARPETQRRTWADIEAQLEKQEAKAWAE